MDQREQKIMEKGFSRIDELKKKIENKHYVEYAISRMANEICEVFFK